VKGILIYLGQRVECWSLREKEKDFTKKSALFLFSDQDQRHLRANASGDHFSDVL
jgi:hypothetical protein